MDIEKALLEKIESLEARVSQLEALFASERQHKTGEKKLSAREFLLTKTLKAETQKLLAIGYYLEHQEGIDAFNVTDLEAAFRSAKEKPPRNINDAVNKNIARGFIMDAGIKKDSKKAWCLTATGESYVETELNK